ncbi:DUF1223 domain-containing protein [Roseovarius aestuariivivens]|uniref:DUF1223 domain-containing protein n=1 Tax=Roseovarius aestuariivivens TaxID=1888910 RepID=UPI0010810BF7|nr:DUF1223 domain-containing protein [Roseovarius aestuariivivens]
MHGLTWAIAAMILAALPARSDETRPVVVELFTSQGCSSCPPADKLLHSLAEQEDIIALALHVDYWDYIGWADSFADPAFSTRQRLYAKTSGRKMVYTPQIVVNGRDGVVANRPIDVADLIDRYRNAPQRVDLNLSRQGDQVMIEATPLSGLKGPLLVQLVRYMPEKTVEITRGENAGKTLSYANIVTDLTRLHTWDGRGPLRLSAEASGDAPLVVLIQRGEGLGGIEAAARLD